MLPIPEYEDYLITEDGKVFSNKSNRYLALRPNTAGYLRVALSKGGKVREFLVHRLVLNTFLPSSDSEKLHVNHINGVITDNSLSNLEWSTPKENQHDSKKRAGFSIKEIEVVCPICGTSFPTYTSNGKLNQKLCSVNCAEANKLKLSGKLFLQYDICFIIWLCTNFPMSYLGPLIGFSDVGFKKLIVRKLGYYPIRNKIYLAHRPSTIEELQDVYAQHQIPSR